MRTMAVIRQESPALNRLVHEGKLAIVGGLYDVRTGEVSFFALDGAISESVLAERPDKRRRRLLPPAELPSSPSAAE
jgi:hypothetical protein